MLTSSTRLRSVTREERAWEAKQSVIGSPSMPRLRCALRQAGFVYVRLRLDDDHEALAFMLRRDHGFNEVGGDRLRKLLMRAFRSAGFRVGWSELCVHHNGGDIIRGMTLTGPVDWVAEKGAPAIELECGA